MGKSCWSYVASTTIGRFGEGLRIRIKNDRTKSFPDRDGDTGHGTGTAEMFASITNAARLAKQQRVIHTNASGPSFVGDLTSVLAQRQPCFAVSPADVDVLSSPQQFYNTLLVSRIMHRRTLN